MTKTFGYLILIPALLALLATTSCGTDKHSGELNRIDSLLAVLDTAETMLNSIDTTQTIASYKVYAVNILKIREGFQSREDSLVWSVITRYGLLRKPLRDYKKHFVNFSNEIETSRKQLDDLKADIRKNIIKTEQIEGYTADEAAFVNYIYLSVKSITENTRMYLDMYIELNPQVEKLLIEERI